MKILALMGNSLPRQPSAEEESLDKSERTGIFGDRHTGGTEDRFVLYRAPHAGENLATVLAPRAQEFGPPIRVMR